MERLKTVYLSILADASVVLHVEGQHGFWMVHADRSQFARYTDPIPLLSDADLPGANSEPQLESFLWSRRLFKQIPVADLIDRGLFQAVERDEVAPGVGLTFVGHSIVKQPILYRSHLFIDTGEHPDGQGLTVLRVKDVLESRPSKALEKHLAAIPAIVSAHRCANPRVFGSVLRGEDHFGSDLDLLVDPREGTTLFNLGGLQHELTELLKVRVQAVTPGDLPKRWRQKVIDEAKPLDRLLIDSIIQRFDEVLKGLVERDGQGRIEDNPNRSTGTAIPTSELEDYITNLARVHGVRYDKTPDDALAEVITRLAYDDVQMDRVELLLLALERAGVIPSENVVPLHINYLREKLNVRRRDE